MNDTLGISLGKLAEDLEALGTAKGTYNASLETLTQSVTTIKNNWDDSESGIVQAFDAQYKDEETKLIEIKDALETLHGTMQTKHTAFTDAEAKAKGLF